MGGYGKTISHVIIGLKTAKGTKQLKVSAGLGAALLRRPRVGRAGTWATRRGRLLLAAPRRLCVST